MKSPPAFVKGAYRAGLRVALREILQGRDHSDNARSARGWKLFLLLPRMLLFRSTTRWDDPQATSLGSIPVVRAKRVDAVVVGQSRVLREGFVGINPAKEDTAGHSRTAGRARADDGVDG